MIKWMLAHRGLWRDPSERNALAALERATQRGYGVETDVRDCLGKPVIAHDMPAGGETPLPVVLDLCSRTGVPLALNVKADGMAVTIRDLLKNYPNLDAFCFDMSVPQLFQYQKHEIPTFTRASEFETSPVLYDRAKGVWLDCFLTNWYAPDLIDSFLRDGKKVAIVSSELHRRCHVRLWTALREHGFDGRDDLMLCTDIPDAATEFFGGMHD